MIMEKDLPKLMMEFRMLRTNRMDDKTEVAQRSTSKYILCDRLLVKFRNKKVILVAEKAIRKISGFKFVLTAKNYEIYQR